MINVTVHDYRNGTIVNVPVNDSLIMELREDFENGMNKKFVTFSDYVEAVVAYNLMLG